jgi:hypothetical protein
LDDHRHARVALKVKAAIGFNCSPRFETVACLSAKPYRKPLDLPVVFAVTVDPVPKFTVPRLEGAKPIDPVAIYFFVVL